MGVFHPIVASEVILNKSSVLYSFKRTLRMKVSSKAATFFVPMEHFRNLSVLMCRIILSHLRTCTQMERFRSNPFCLLKCFALPSPLHHRPPTPPHFSVATFNSPTFSSLASRALQQHKLRALCALKKGKRVKSLVPKHKKRA